MHACCYFCFSFSCNRQNHNLSWKANFQVVQTIAARQEFRVKQEDETPYDPNFSILVLNSYFMTQLPPQVKQKPWLVQIKTKVTECLRLMSMFKQNKYLRCIKHIFKGCTLSNLWLISKTARSFWPFHSHVCRISPVNHLVLTFVSAAGGFTGLPQELLVLLKEKMCVILVQVCIFGC